MKYKLKLKRKGGRFHIEARTKHPVMHGLLVLAARDMNSLYFTVAPLVKKKNKGETVSADPRTKNSCGAKTVKEMTHLLKSPIDRFKDRPYRFPRYGSRFIDPELEEKFKQAHIDGAEITNDKMGGKIALSKKPVGMPNPHDRQDDIYDVLMEAQFQFLKNQSAKKEAPDTQKSADNSNSMKDKE